MSFHMHLPFNLLVTREKSPSLKVQLIDILRALPHSQLPHDNGGKVIAWICDLTPTSSPSI